MSEFTKIEWATHTWSPWIGCSKAHTGCLNCYVERDFAIRRKRVVWGTNGTRVKTSESYWQRPLKWNREVAARGERVRVFPSLCDPFEMHPAVGHWRCDFGDLIGSTPWIDWLLLTKRPWNIRKVFGSRLRTNVWLIYSASDQESLEYGIRELLACRSLAPVIGLSLEPLVGPVDLSAYMGGPYVGLPGDVVHANYNAGIDWVIIGGESGPHARPCCLEWIDDVRRQCQAAGVPVFVKQLGRHPVTSNVNIWEYTDTGPAWGETAAGCFINISHSKGGDPDEWPDELRVRQFPATATRPIPPELRARGREAVEDLERGELELLALDGEDDAPPSGRPDPWKE